MIVRPLEDRDIPAAIAAIVDGAKSPESEQPFDVAPYARAARAAREQGHEILVAEVRGEVIGVCQLLILQHFHHAGGRCAELEAVFVRADQRGKGAGAALIGEAERLAREAGCYRLQLTSNKVRHDAHRFYLAHGFEASHEGFKKDLEADLTQVAVVNVKDEASNLERADEGTRLQGVDR
ncbi:MAG TPA: GNAT family N-acetyltransferase [Acidimicrobiales bacterium]|nr:GNAT family N-acetyltransferase [Acidimicrobiales bacterium]